MKKRQSLKDRARAKKQAKNGSASAPVNDDDKDISPAKIANLKWYQLAREQTVETLPTFVRDMMSYNHNEDTISHAMVCAMIGTVTALIPKEDVTEYMKTRILWSFIEAWTGAWGHPLRLVDYETLLNPKHESLFTEVAPQQFNWVMRRAQELIALQKKNKSKNVSPDLMEHWVDIAAGNVPFGLELTKPA